MYQHPGVYIQHAVSSALAIEAASTSVAAFVGNAHGLKNTSRTGAEPVFVTGVSQYNELFGQPGGNAGGIWNEGGAPDEMGHAVNLFFANGGSRAYICHVGKATPGEATATIEFKDGQKKHKIVLTAKLPEQVAKILLVRLEKKETDGAYKLTIAVDGKPIEADVQKRTLGAVREVFDPVSMDSARADFIDEMLKGSAIFESTTTDSAAANPPALPLNAKLAGGTKWQVAEKAEYDAAFESLRDYRDVSIILLPGLYYGERKVDPTIKSAAPIYQSALTHAGDMKNRMVVIDPNPELALTTPAEVTAAGFPTESEAALYHPQLTVPNPYHDPDTAPDLPKTFNVGPAAAAAGIWARIDGTRGVWKTPAGLEATVRGALTPTILIGNDIQDNLNDAGVNCLRSIIGPLVVWGGRTLATKARPQFRYISVRRTQSMIGESLYRALQAVVFEPNDYRLWGALRASTSDFMEGLHRAGAFQGEKASDAWYVRCGLGSTMTQGDIDAGIVRLVVGFAPLKPAEFVVCEVQQKVGQSA